MRAYILIFFLFLSILLLSPVHATPSDIPTSKYAAHIQVKALQYGVKWNIDMHMNVTDRNYVCMDGSYAYMYAQFDVDNIPTYIWKQSNPGYILKKAEAELVLEGTHSYTVAKDSQSEPSHGWGDIGSIGLASVHLGTPIIVEENRDGTYFWKLHLHLYYEHSTALGGTDTYTIDYNLCPTFQEFTIVSFSQKGDWESQMEQGVTKAFSQILNVWTVAAQKIQDINWFIGFDALRIVGNIILAFSYVAMALFRTFQAPILTISLIMGNLSSPMVVSFFLVSLVLVVLMTIAIVLVLWKVIILVKP